MSTAPECNFIGRYKDSAQIAHEAIDQVIDKFGQHLMA